MISTDITNYRVLYPNTENGGVCVLIPTSECPSIERLLQDVPDGLPYEVVSVDDIPTDRTYRNAWTFEEA